MNAINYFYLEDERQWLGYLQDYPDYWEEAESFERLQANLSCLHFDLTVMKALRNSKAA